MPDIIPRTCAYARRILALHTRAGSWVRSAHDGHLDFRRWQGLWTRKTDSMSPIKTPNGPHDPHGLRPSISSVPFTYGPPVLRLTTRDREHLASISALMRVTAGTVLVRGGEDARAVFCVSAGTLVSFRERSDGTRKVMGFLFAEDMFGLAKRGVYVN